MDNLLENESWYFERRWIPYGCYHDLMDNTNTAPNNAGEFWDVVQGVTIQQMYYAHNSAVTNMCIYRSNFTFLNPNLNQAGVNNIFNWHEVFCR